MKLKTNIKAGAIKPPKNKKQACALYQKWFKEKPTYSNIEKQAKTWGCKWAQ